MAKRPSLGSGLVEKAAQARENRGRSIDARLNQILSPRPTPDKIKKVK